MTDPIKALADAAREVAVMVRKTASDELQPRHYFGELHYILTDDLFALSNALAAYDAAQVSQPPSDAEIDAWVRKIIKARHDNDSTRFDEQILSGCDLMRRARPDAGLLRAAKELLKDTHPSNRDNFIVSNYVVDDLRAEVARVEGK